MIKTYKCTTLDLDSPLENWARLEFPLSSDEQVQGSSSIEELDIAVIRLKFGKTIKLNLGVFELIHFLE